MLRATQLEHGIAMQRFYELVGITRQAHFQHNGRLEQQRAMMLEIEPLVHLYRKHKDRRAGARSLYYNLNIKQRCGIGVNKFEYLMRAYGLSLAPFRSKVVTTRSCARSRTYPNLCKGLTINGINQLVVGDLTYLMFPSQVYYLFLLTDVYSARIVGWQLGQRMRAIEAKQALDKWVKLRGVAQLKDCIHHTDGGSQYFSNLYHGAMKGYQLQISVAKTCLDNGFAEQRNGLFKHHLLPTIKQVTPKKLAQQIDKILYFYNQERKQEALQWLSPVQYEARWKDDPQAPTLQLYDRQAKQPTVRQGF